MSSLLGVALAVPLVGAVATVAVGWLVDARTARSAGVASAVLAATSWAVLASADTVPQIGRIEADPLSSVAIAGLALLVAAHLPTAPLAASSSLCAVTVFAAASTTGSDGADRPLAVGVAVLVLLAAARLRAEAASVLTVAGLVCAGALVTVGLLLADEAPASVLVFAGAAVAMVVAVASGTAVLLAPVVLYAAARAADAGHEARATEDVDVVGIGGVAATVAATIAVHLLVRARARRGAGAPLHVLPVSAVLAAMVVLVQDVDTLRAAGLLLAAGAVIAAASSRPIALVACVPGLAAVVEVFGDATGGVHAAAGAAAALVLVGMATAALPASSTPLSAERDWPLLAAGGFAILPVWGWSDAGDAGYPEAVAVAAAAGSVVAAGIVLARLVPPGSPRVLDKLRSRQPAANHGSTYPQAEEVDPEVDPQVDAEFDPEVDPEIGAAPQGRGDPSAIEEPDGRARHDGLAAQHPVAGPPGPVPDRAAAGGVRGRRRLRARPGPAPR